MAHPLGSIGIVGNEERAEWLEQWCRDKEDHSVAGACLIRGKEWGVILER